jgi:hypothetical protein
VKKTTKEKIPLRITHIGNSIQFVNDCPKLLEHMLETRFTHILQDACLVGGATFPLLIGDRKYQCLPEFIAPVQDENNKVISSESLLKQKWDYIIMNDQTQFPAREKWRKASKQVLRDKYLPLIQEKSSQATIILIMTAAYTLSTPGEINYSGDLGSFDDFTKLLKQGYDEYASILPNSKIAHMGLAYQHIKKDYEKELWGKMYIQDGYHPSPHGTYLEACVIYCTMLGEIPSVYDLAWWEDGRDKKPPIPYPLPSDEDARLLREVASRVCGITV